MAPPLDYSPEVVENAYLWKCDATSATTCGNRAYTILPELARVAKVVAESADNTPSGNHSDVAADIRCKYG
jgi:hypothetical protein